MMHGTGIWEKNPLINGPRKMDPWKKIRGKMVPGKNPRKNGPGKDDPQKNGRGR